MLNSVWLNNTFLNDDGQGLPKTLFPSIPADTSFSLDSLPTVKIFPASVSESAEVAVFTLQYGVDIAVENTSALGTIYWIGHTVNIVADFSSPFSVGDKRAVALQIAGESDVAFSMYNKWIKVAQAAEGNSPLEVVAGFRKDVGIVSYTASAYKIQQNIGIVPSIAEEVDQSVAVGMGIIRFVQPFSLSRERAGKVTPYLNEWSQGNPEQSTWTEASEMSSSWTEDSEL